MPSNNVILCYPLLLLLSIFPSLRGFPNESAICIRWPKYWSFSFSMSPSSEYSGLLSKDDDMQIITSILNQKASLSLPGAEALQKHQTEQPARHSPSALVSPGRGCAEILGVPGALEPRCAGSQDLPAAGASERSPVEWPRASPFSSRPPSTSKGRGDSNP